ncbi:sugar ABC transporter permease [Litorilinea aerophila]|uniref:Sugar ABC transporter permease n=1 Tax=Litorilinea aerophila TaxID=1204385 RepID=A0A540VC96_9CHLR|nr:sugar ABC transporter permease [Litorilinea aerophila]MCC9077763.1 sugar ABC transporter permease [Litorilinea aerophila]GIV79047.1 MAG: sugar ABC transporter permease [Litorilinea sp.]
MLQSLSRPTAHSRRILLGYLLVAPLLLWLAGTILYPLLSAVLLSLQDIKIIGTPGAWVGTDNYARALADSRFWQALGRSGLWVLANGVLQTVAAFATALILNQRFPGQKMARVWIILSWIVPTVVVVIIWRWLLSSSGVVNYLLVSLGLLDGPMGFFSTRNSAAMSVVAINAWRWFPFMAVMVLAGLQNIPRELYEAAAVDGAAAVQMFFRITLPLLQPVLFVLGLVGTLLSFNVFDIIWLLTGGGPSGATTTLPVLIYETAFTRYRLSQAAAISVLSGLLLMIFAILFIRFMSPREEDA